jgi:hypothetical protein
MPLTTHLLERAYQLIEANQIQNAELVLDAVVRVDPTNVDAWITYLQIHQDQNDLDWIRERILKTRELSARDKNDLLEYQRFLSNQLQRTQAEKSASIPENIYNLTHRHEAPVPDENTKYEVIQVFDYPSMNKTPAQKRRPRRRTLLNWIPSSTTSRAIALLVLFFISIRMLVIGSFLGYIILAAFLAGCAFWLVNYSSDKPSAAPNLDMSRAFTLETKHDLSIVDKPSTETAKGPKKARKPKKQNN